MSHAMGIRSMFRRPGTTMMYLAAAGAMYAWRNRKKTHGALPSERTETHDAAGITGLPPDAEAAQQASLPERGTRKDGVHA